MPLGYTLLILSLYVLVAARLTRMVNYDVILDWLRLWVARRASTALTVAQESGMIVNHDLWVRRYNRWVIVEDFIRCPWCIGLWVSLALAPVPIHILGWSWWALIALPFAASHLIGAADRFVSEDVEIVDEP